MNDFVQYSELYHHGIKGMHWGIRRYQNPDGSLTPEGKRRYNLSDEDAYKEYLKEESKIEKGTETAAHLSLLSSLIGSIAVGAAAAPTGPGSLVTAMATMTAGTLGSAAVLDKLENKKMDTLKKSYGKERIEQMNKLLQSASISKTLDDIEEYKYYGINTFDILSTAQMESINDKYFKQSILEGRITTKDIKNYIENDKNFQKAVEKDKKINGEGWHYKKNIDGTISVKNKSGNFSYSGYLRDDKGNLVYYTKKNSNKRRKN